MFKEDWHKDMREEIAQRASVLVKTQRAFPELFDAFLDLLEEEGSYFHSERATCWKPA